MEPVPGRTMQTLVSGSTNLSTPLNVTQIDIKTAEEMHKAVFEHLDTSDVIIKVAAVADYRPVDPANQKIKKKGGNLELQLEQNVDILKEVGKKKKGQIVVGFAAETQDLKENAEKKLKGKNLDMIVGNIVGSPSSGFGTDTNKVTLFHKDGTQESIPMMEKDAVAHIILDRVLELAK